MLEALSVATMARTAALLTENRPVVGTGTDCIVVVCPVNPAGETFAGLHTDIGQHITTSVFRAVRTARREWEHDRDATLPVTVGLSANQTGPAISQLS